MDGYTQVKDRIPEFWERFPEGRILATDPVVVEIGGKTFVGVSVALYADRTDDRPISRASSWEPFPGTTNFTRDSEMENAETSAIGRAMGALGIGIQHGFASADEIQNRRAEPEPQMVTAAAAKLGIVDRLTPHVEDPTGHAAEVWRGMFGESKEPITTQQWDALCDAADRHVADLRELSHIEVAAEEATWD